MASTRGRWSSPERTIVWTEPKPKPTTTMSSSSSNSSKVPVVYYLCRRNGQLDHPHFLEVPLDDHDGRLYLRNVTDRLKALRGEAMPAAYSWSSKRSYKNNGYVWHDLTADDLILPAHGNEYVLKGSELLLLLPAPLPEPCDASASASASSSSNQNQPDDAAATRRRKNWSSFDLADYRRTADADADADADAATRTMATLTELGIDEISPPPSSSSPDTLETLIKNDARAAVAKYREQRQEEEEVGVIAGGRMRASTMLMQLISCGTMRSVKGGGGKAASGAGLGRFPRGRSELSDHKVEEYSVSGEVVDIGDLSMSSAAAGGGEGGVMAERDYFSGSLVETKTVHVAGAGELKRSASYNADRGESRLGMRETKMDGGRQQQNANNNSKSTARRRKLMTTMSMPLNEESPYQT